MEIADIEAEIEAEAAAVAPQRGTRDLTTGPVAKTLLLFTIPTLGANVLQSLNQTISTIYLGKLLGENALAASANAAMISFLVFSTVFGLAMGATILIGQAMGRKDIAEVRRNVGSATGMFLFLGVLVSLLGYVFTPGMLRLLGTPKEVFQNADIFLRLMFVSMPFVFLSVMLQSALRGVGDAVTPLYCTILGVVLALVLNPLFISGWGPIPAMGIEGAALAGFLASLIGFIYVVWRIYARDLIIRLRGPEWHLIRPDWAHMKPILAIGLPMGLSMIVMSASTLFVMKLINLQGAHTAAAFGAINQLWSYVQMPAFAVGSAVSAMAAQNIGAGKWDRINRITLTGIVTNVIMSAILVAITTFAARPSLGLFLPLGSEAIDIGIHIQWMVGWSFVLAGVSMIVSSVVRANGAVIVPLLILICGSVFVRLGIAYGGYDRFGVDAIWASFGGASIAMTVLSLVYYLGGSWRKLRISSGASPAAVG